MDGLGKGAAILCVCKRVQLVTSHETWAFSLHKSCTITFIFALFDYSAAFAAVEAPMTVGTFVHLDLAVAPSRTLRAVARVIMTFSRDFMAKLHRSCRICEMI